MRALDCHAPDAHDDIHFTADSDEHLTAQIRQHRDDYHPELSDDQISEMVASNAYDE